MGSSDDERIEAYINQIKNDEVLKKHIDSEKSGGLKEFLKEMFSTVITVAVGALVKAVLDHFDL